MNAPLPQRATLNLHPDTTSHATERYFCLEKQFAWPMPGNKVEVLKTGQATFEEIVKAIRGAEKFVWLADWQMAYDVELDQRGTKEHSGRLTAVIEALIKDKPVQVRVLLFRSIKDTIPGTYDGLVQKTINALNKKGYKGRVIVTLQAPTSNQNDAWDYSHHQKFVVVDGKIGFVGGIDLTHGRFETAEYDVVIDPSRNILNEMYNPGCTRLRSMSPDEQELVKQGFAPPYGGFLLDEGCQPRLPWQDVHLKLAGPAVVDLHRNFVRRWNAILWDLERKANPRAPYRISSPAQETITHPAAIDSAWLDHYGATATLQSAQTDERGKTTVQIVRSVSSLHLWQESTRGFRFQVPDDLRFYPDPKHRAVMAESIEKNRGEHQPNILHAMVNCIRSAQNYIYLENQFFISDFGKAGMPEMRRTRGGSILYYPVDSKRIGNEGDGIKNTILDQLAIRIDEHIAAKSLFHVYLVFPVHPEGSVADQVVWKQQWLALATIRHGTNSLVNRVRKSLKAHGRSPDEWKQYLTVLNMRSYGVAVQYERDPKTFREDFTREIGRYVVTEQIYVHSKLMIVDDAVAIIGSANVNDRSLTGNGDTEIAAVVVDDDKPTERDLGDPATPGQTRTFARDLRRSLWEKHFGFALNPNAYFKSTTRAERAGAKPHELPEGSHPPRAKTTEADFSRAANNIASWRTVLDKPCAPETVKAIQAIAENNARAYEAVFLHTPRNGMKGFDELIGHYTRAYPAVSEAKAIYLKRQAEMAKADDLNREYTGTLTPAQREERRIDREKRYADAIAAIPSQASTLGVIPPALQPKFMTTALAPYQKSGLQVPLEEFHKRYVVYDGDQVHNIGPAIDYLKRNVLGFFVAMPLDWGSGTKVDGDPTSGPAWIDLGKAPEPPTEVKPA